MTLGEWLNRVILDDDGDSGDWDGMLERYPGFGGSDGGGDDQDDALKAIVERLTGRLEAAERRSTLALSGVDQSVLALTRRLEALEDGGASGEAVEAALSRARTQQDELLERVRKLERGGPGGDPAGLKAVENTVGKLAGRLYETERDVRAELDNLAHKDEQQRDSLDKTGRVLSERLDDAERRLTAEQRELRDRLELEGQRSGDLRTSLEAQARSLQSRIIAAENATHRAAEALVQSQERLDDRLRTLESTDAVGVDDINRRFETLSRELASLIRETREDCARRIAEVAGSAGDGQRMERALEATEARLAKAEDRQSLALNRIGEEVSRLALAVDRRIEEAERRLEQKLTDTEERRDGQRSRADLDSRLERVREENTAAVRRIGEQMARLGENLADRVQQAEIRSAAAVEQAGERMAQVVEKLETRQSADTGADLETRIQASEERTAQRIDQAMEKVHQRLDQARSETADALSPVQRAMTALADRLEAIEHGRTVSAPTSADTPDKQATRSTPAAALSAAEDSLDLDTPLPQPPGLKPQNRPRDAARSENKADSFVVEAEGPERLSPLENRAPLEDRVRKPREQLAAEDFGDQVPAPTQPRRKASLGATADPDFLAAARQTVRVGGSSTRPQWSDPEEASSGGGKVLLIAASVLGFGAVAAAAGMLALEAMGGGGQSAARPAQASASEGLSSVFAEPAATPTAASDSAPAETVTEPDPTDTSSATDQTASQATPSATPGPTPVEPSEAAAAPAVTDPDAPLIAAIEVQAPSLEDAAAAGDAIARFQLAARLQDAGQISDAAALMRRAAEQGVPEAMRRYGLMLTRGDGVSQDLQAGRAFVVRAAEAGNVQAMHDAGGLYINAPESEQTQAAAARWFQEGALHGLSDSQFNMALLFQEGFGVPQSAADAYTWFLIAARGGDSDAGDRAARLRPSLNTAARTEAEQIAANFTPRTIVAEAQGRYPAQAWNGDPAQLTARAQALLTNLGYDAGPADGVLGERTRRAIVRYQRDTGLEPGSPLTASLVARLEESAAS
jgi:localization factor PodJL